MKSGAHIALFFTWDVSLEIWRDKGLLQREVRFYEALAERGYKVTFLTWGGEGEREIAKSLKNIEVFPLYEKIPRPNNKALRAMMSLAAPYAARSVLSKAGVIKTNQMWGGWCAVLAKLIFRKPLIVRSGFELYRFTIQQGHGLWRRAFVGFISLLTYRAADLICLATDEDADFVIDKFHIKKDIIDIRPNWIDTDFFAPLETEEKENAVLFVGRLNRQKNIESLIEAVAGAPFTLEVFGDGELGSELEDRATTSGAKVILHGTVANDRLPEIYCRYPVYVLPSHFEGNPKTLLEAMACGRAVLGNNAPGIAPIIKDGENGLLCDGSAASIRHGISRLMDDPGLRQVLGEKARAQIAERQSFDKMLDREANGIDSLTVTEAK